MRLNQIKLSGFKSFAEPTTFQLPGQRVGVVGPNGCGKSTLMNMIAGLLKPDQGRNEVDGIDVAQAPRKALARMGVLSDAKGLYPRLTARENIGFGNTAGGSRQAEGLHLDRLRRRRQSLRQRRQVGCKRACSRQCQQRGNARTP